MHFKDIVSTVVLIATIQLVFAKLEHRKVYTIQNAQDKMYLTAADNGEYCKKRGDVITAKLKNPADKAQEWGYRENTKEGWQFLLSGYFNEITYEHLCGIYLNIFNITQIHKDEYIIENTKTKKCVRSSELEKRITWDNCKTYNHKSKKHYWKFVALSN